jgi:hypothetical protein
MERMGRMDALLTLPFSTTIQRWHVGGVLGCIGDRLSFNFKRRMVIEH